MLLVVCVYIYMWREGRERRYGNGKLWCERVDGPSVGLKGFGCIHLNGEKTFR